VTLANHVQGTGRRKTSVARVRLVPKPGGVRIVACCSYRTPQAPAGAHPTRPPDIDKVARALLDALTGIAYTDDAQVVDLIISKRYGPADAIAITIAQVAP
jgi:Holliday junction resolvase RusA-like endonuclease